MVTQGTGTAMAANDGFFAYFKSIVETGFGSMAHIHHNTQAVHFLNYLLTKWAQTAVFCISLSRIADVVIAIMAKRHIYNTAFGKMFQQTKVFSYGIAVFYSQHDGFLSCMLETCNIWRFIGNIHFCTIGRYHLFYLRKDAVGFRCCSQKRLGISLALLQVCYHDGSIQKTFSHLGKVNQHLICPLGKHLGCKAFREEHGRIAMAVQRNDSAMDTLGFCKGWGFCYEPVEERHHTTVASGNKAFRVPLNTYDALEFVALDGLYHTICCLGCNT